MSFWTDATKLASFSRDSEGVMKNLKFFVTPLLSLENGTNFVVIGPEAHVQIRPSQLILVLKSRKY